MCAIDSGDNFGGSWQVPSQQDLELEGTVLDPRVTSVVMSAALTSAQVSGQVATPKVLVIIYFSQSLDSVY